MKILLEVDILKKGSSVFSQILLSDRKPYYNGPELKGFFILNSADKIKMRVKLNESITRICEGFQELVLEQFDKE